MTPQQISERFEEIDGYIAAMDDRLRSIARQNAVLAEMVEVLGSCVNTTTDALQQHIDDKH